MNDKQIEARNEKLEEEKEKKRLLKEDIAKIHDQNMSDWIHALKSAEKVVRKAFKTDRVFSDADLVTIAGQMVMTISNRRMAQEAVQARIQQQAQRGRVVRPGF
jgi:hypothetical protein